MNEPVRTPPFAPFEWLLSGRYLRARRKEGFISVIAGFSFLGIMLGVATLIIVMAVMNGFRKELLDKILGLNGHLLVQPLESPLTDWKDVAERISQVQGIRLAAPVVDGQALASSPFNASGVFVRGIRADDLNNLTSIAKNIKQGTLEGFDEGQGVAIGRRLADQLSLHAGDSITLVAPRGAVTPMGTTPRIKPYKIAAVFEIGMSEYDAGLRVHAAAGSAGLFQSQQRRHRDRGVHDQSRQDRYLSQDGDRGRGPAGVPGRLAAAQFDLLQCAAGRAQCDVPDPDHDRAGRGAQHRLRPDHAGEGQGQDIAILRTMGASQGSIMRIFLITGAAIGVVGTLTGFFVGMLICLNIESIRQFLSWMTNTELFSPELYFLSKLPAEIDFGETVGCRDHGADAVLSGDALSVVARRAPRSCRRAAVRVRTKWPRGRKMYRLFISTR